MAYYPLLLVAIAVERRVFGQDAQRFLERLIRLQRTSSFSTLVLNDVIGLPRPPKTDKSNPATPRCRTTPSRPGRSYGTGLRALPISCYYTDVEGCDCEGGCFGLLLVYALMTHLRLLVLVYYHHGR